MQNASTTIRLSVKTVERMKQEILGIIAAVDANQRADPGIAAEAINPRTLGLTYDQLINLLLDQRETQRRRDRRHRAKKKGQGAVELSAGLELDQLDGPC